MQIFTPIGAIYLSPGKNTYFPYRGLLRGYRPMLYIFGKLSSTQCYATFDIITLRLTVFEIFAVKIFCIASRFNVIQHAL